MPRAKPDPSDLAARLDLIARLLAYLVAAQHDTLKLRAVTLQSLGLEPAEIARVCNTTSNTIRVRLAEATKKKRGSRRSAGRRPRKASNARG